MKPEKEYSVWAAGGIGSTKKATIKSRLAAANDLLCKFGYMWIESTQEYRAFNTAEAVNQCSCSGTARGDPNCKVHGISRQMFLVLAQSKTDPKHVWPLMETRSDGMYRGHVVSFNDIAAARMFRAECDSKFTTCKHYIIEL